MKREQKSDLVRQLSERLERASIALVSEYGALSASESNEMRGKLRAVRGELRVAKNTLIRRAIDGTAFQSLATLLGGRVGLIFSFGDPIELIKAVALFKELGDKFKIRGGVLDGKPLTSDEVQTLATLPPREVVMSQLLGLICAPAAALVRLLSEPGSALARLVDAIGRKREEQAGGAPG